jgi:surface protein
MVDESHNDLSNMFYHCTNLISVNTEDWDTSNVTNMEGVFQDCRALTSLNVSNWDTSNVIYMNNMFWGCQSITSLDLSSWHTSNATNVSQMFNGCSSLTSLNISNFDIRTTDRNWILTNCTSLHTLRLDNCNNTTINMIITSEDFPTNAIDGVTRTIYCKESEATGLTPPTNWVFSFVEEEKPDTCEYCGELDCDGSCQEITCDYCGLPASECTCAPCEQCGMYGCAGTCQDPCPYCGEVGCGGSCIYCEQCGNYGCNGSCAYCEQCGMYHDPGSICP